MVDALTSTNEQITMRAVYDACRLPADTALSLAVDIAEEAPGLSRLVRDCALPRDEAIAELEALIVQRDPLSAVAVLELHRLGARDSVVLSELGAQDDGLAGWLASYSVDMR